MLPWLSTKCAPPSAWSAVCGRVGSRPSSQRGSLPQLKWEAWLLAPALSPDDNGHGVYIPEINLPKHRVVFLSTLKSTLLQGPYENRMGMMRKSPLCLKNPGLRQYCGYCFAVNNISDGHKTPSRALRPMSFPDFILQMT